MHGKATLILTDKDTGRVVERREEQNMLTNALSRIFSQPPELAYCDASQPRLNGYLPMYSNILKGLVLFEETLPENPDDFMLSGKYRFLATAGDPYSGTDLKRGSFNASQSCEIENGYRFVWDFAPEKAVGTIRCLGLSNRYHGNCGDAANYSNNSGFMVNPPDLNDINYNRVNVLSGSSSGFFFLEKDRCFYNFQLNGYSVLIRKWRLPNLRAIRICDKMTPVVESTAEIPLDLYPSYYETLYDPSCERLYLVQSANEYASEIGKYRIRVKYAAINPFTGEKTAESTDWIATNIYFNQSLPSTYAVVFGGKIYISVQGKIYVCSLSGTLEKTLDFGIYSFEGFITVDGKLVVNCKLSQDGAQCLKFLDEPNSVICNFYKDYPPIPSTTLKAPYSYMQSNSSVNIGLRTDYLATINNLSAPLIKTDQHALQVRYEITN